MMMVLPLLIIVLLPKVLNTNDPEMRKVKQNTSGHIKFFIAFTYSFIHWIELYSILFLFSSGNGAVYEYVES